MTATLVATDEKIFFVWSQTDLIIQLKKMLDFNFIHIVYYSDDLQHRRIMMMNERTDVGQTVVVSEFDFFFSHFFMPFTEQKGITS